LMADYDGANAVSCLMILNVGWYNHQLFFYVDDVAEVDGMWANLFTELNGRRLGGRSNYWM